MNELDKAIDAFSDLVGRMNFSNQDSLLISIIEALIVNREYQLSSINEEIQEKQTQKSQIEKSLESLHSKLYNSSAKIPEIKNPSYEMSTK